MGLTSWPSVLFELTLVFVFTYSPYVVLTMSWWIFSIEEILTTLLFGTNSLSRGVERMHVEIILQEVTALFKTHSLSI